jgi:hypothetical protein
LTSPALSHRSTHCTMPPKKSSASTKRNIDQVEQKTNDDTKNEDQKINNGEDGNHQSDGSVPEKAEPASKKVKTKSKVKESDAKPNSKRATRSSVKTASKHDSKAIIQFLLSDDAITMLDQLETSDNGDFQFPRDRQVAFFRFSLRELNISHLIASTPSKTSSPVAWSPSLSATEWLLAQSTISSAKKTH